MTSRLGVLRTLCILVVAATAPLLAQSRAAMEIQITWVDPDTATTLPQWVRGALRSRRCLVPQVHSNDLLSNIVSGRLVDAATPSYALLCSHDGISSVIVITPDSTLNPPSILTRPDTSFLVEIKRAGVPWRREFGRFLYVITPSEVKDWCPLPPGEGPLVHNGIITFHQDRDPTPYYFAKTTREWIACKVPDSME